MDENFLDKEVVDGPPSGMKKMYLSGPMTGIENFNHSLFNSVAEEFRESGFEVCNPAEFFDGDTTLDRKDYMRESIKWLLEADTVVLLPGWMDSEGAKLEAKIATELDLIIVEYITDDAHREELEKRDLEAAQIKEQG